MQNSVLLEGYVESVDTALNEDTGEVINAILWLQAPRVPIEITHLMRAKPNFDPILMKWVLIIGTIQDDGETPYIIADHLVNISKGA